jgi:transposase
MNGKSPGTFERFLGIDLHKHYLVVGGVNAEQEVVLPPRRVNLENWLKWAEANLKPTDAVVLEATTNAWEIYDQVLPVVGRAVVANPVQVKWIASARVKTDRVDVGRLACLLAAGLVPEVWVPPVEVRELRSLLAHRRRLVKMQATIRNRLHSMIHRHNLTLPKGEVFSHERRSWWLGLEISRTENLRIRQDLATMDHLEPQIAEIDTELNRLSTCAPWVEQVPYLLQLPGFGLITTMTLLAAIGDITRFESARKLVGYSGLGAGVHASGQTHHSGRITKQGRAELRWVLVEAAWVAATTHAHWKREFERLSRRMSPKKAIVAVAHKLLVVVWHVLAERTADTEANAEMVASKLIGWSGRLGEEGRGGLTTRRFVRYHLMKLKLGDDLKGVRQGRTTRLLASPEEVLALRPELKFVC